MDGFDQGKYTFLKFRGQNSDPVLAVTMQNLFGNY